jgi:flagellar hook-basal body complex protein FliE
VAAPAEAASPLFQGLFDGIQKVDDLQRVAESMQNAFARGADIPMHSVMAATQKAALTVEMAVVLRNRALEAYQEVMRMQV